MDTRQSGTFYTRLQLLQAFMDHRGEHPPSILRKGCRRQHRQSKRMDAAVLAISESPSYWFTCFDGGKESGPCWIRTNDQGIQLYASFLARWTISSPANEFGRVSGARGGD